MVIAWVFALFVHIVVCVMGTKWGGERGKSGEGFLLTFCFSIFGLIAIACLPLTKDADEAREKERDELRLLRRRLDAIAVELTEQGAMQQTIASSTLASAQLLAIIAKGVETDES